MVAAILVLLVVLGGLIFAFGNQLGFFDGKKQQVTLESYIGQQRDVARTALEDLGFVVEFET
ncbi:MAG: hypothetical protein ACR2FU_16975, partial [Streptosporangiaceae bacterium]